MKRAGGGRSGGIKEGGRTAEVQPVGDCGGVDAGLPPPPLLHLTTTITSNLLRLMASLTDHPRFFLFFFLQGKEKKRESSSVLTWKTQPTLAAVFQPKIKKLTDLQVLGKIHPGATQVFFLVGSFSSSPLVWVSSRPRRSSLGVMSCQPWVGVQPEAEATGHGGPPAITCKQKYDEFTFSYEWNFQNSPK